MALAFAVGELLLDTYSAVLFVTHFPQVTLLTELYANAKNLHFKTRMDPPTSRTTVEGAANEVVFMHELGDGPCEIESGYGLLMAELCSIPPSILQAARKLRHTLREKHALRIPQRMLIDDTVRVVGFLLHHLTVVLKNASLDSDGLRQYLVNTKSRIGSKAAEVLGTLSNVM